MKVPPTLTIEKKHATTHYTTQQPYQRTIPHNEIVQLDTRSTPIEQKGTIAGLAIFTKVTGLGRDTLQTLKQ